MSMTDPIADMLTRIRNANKANHTEVEIPASRMKASIAKLLLEQGYITGFESRAGEHGELLVIGLKYGKNRERVISGIKRVSKPGRRIYARKDDAAEGPGRPRHGDHLHVTWSGDQRRGAAPRPRRRGHLLHLVGNECHVSEEHPSPCRPASSSPTTTAW